MDTLICTLYSYPVSNRGNVTRSPHGIVLASHPSKKHNHKKQQLPKNLRHRRRTETPPDFHPILRRLPSEDPPSDSEETVLGVDVDDGNLVWDTDEIEAISSLFQGRVPQRPGKLNRERPSPLPLPHKIRPLRLPTSKKISRTQLACSNRQTITNQVYKNPTFLLSLAREIRSLPSDNKEVSSVLSKWTRFLRKGSLSLTIRELGHMGLPERALHVFCWVQKQPHLFPDDRVLASTVEVLAKAHELKMPFDLGKFLALSSQSVYESMVKGFIKGGNLRLAWKLLSVSTQGRRLLDPGIYAKLISQFGKNPDKRTLVFPLLEELAKRDYLKLTQQDCTCIMKICAKLGKFDMVEELYDWFKKSGGSPSVVMYTMVIHSRCLENEYREAMGVVWEMEGSNCLLDLPAYRVLIRLFVALNDLPRTARYFSKLKESGFCPTYDIYREVIEIYKDSGRLAKCKEIRREAEMAGHRFGAVSRRETM